MISNVAKSILSTLPAQAWLFAWHSSFSAFRQLAAIWTWGRSASTATSCLLLRLLLQSGGDIVSQPDTIAFNSSIFSSATRRFFFFFPIWTNLKHLFCNLDQALSVAWIFQKSNSCSWNCISSHSHTSILSQWSHFCILSFTLPGSHLETI